MRIRKRQELIDFGWKFRLGDFPDAKELNYDDSAWRSLDLPHDWSIEGEPAKDAQTGSSGGFLPAGIGWYRKRLSVSEEELENIVEIEFEGIYMNSEIWVNGQYLGMTYNGYINRLHDLTKYLKPGNDNTIAVRVDCSGLPNCRWYSGCGIYRHVWLSVRKRLSIPKYGVYITTPEISLEKALVEIQTRIENISGGNRRCRLETVILDSNGSQVAMDVSSVKSNADSVMTVCVDVLTPNLWSCETPYLYKAVTKAVDNGIVVDEIENTFGIRSIQFNPEQGFLLNGRKVFLKGMNLHHDLGCLGAAAHDRAIERRLKSVKEMGCNAIRLAHNPHAPHLLDCCDRMGLLVFAECFDRWVDYKVGNSRKEGSFEESWREDLKSFILRDRNHPCIFIWSVGNEVRQQRGHEKGDWQDPKTLKDFGVAMLKEKVDFVHSLEPSRKVTCALFPGREKGTGHKDKSYDMSEPANMSFHMDVVSGNYLQKFYARDHRTYPEMVFIASEVTTNCGGNTWFSVDHDYVCGIFFWGGTDYLGESTSGWPQKGWATGLIDLCDRLKPLGYRAKALYSDEPIVHIGVYDRESVCKIKNSDAVALEWNEVQLEWQPVKSHWNWSSASSVKLATYTNCEEVELHLNGRCLGRKKLSDCEMSLMEWEIPYEPGTLKAVAYSKGQAVATHELHTAGKAERLELLNVPDEIRADRQEIVYIDVAAKDSSGNIVPGCSQPVKFAVGGPAEIVGVDNADMFSTELFVGNTRRLCEGRCMLVLRSTGGEGDITISASAPDMATAVKTVSAHFNFVSYLIFMLDNWRAV